MEEKIENIASHPRAAGGQWWNPANNEFMSYIQLANPRCRDFHLEFYRCTSRIGLQNAETKCKEQFDDLQECAVNRKRMMRLNFIKAERLRQGRPPLKKMPAYAETYGDLSVNTEDMYENDY